MTLLPADDADVVRVGQLLCGGVRVQGIHVVYRPPGQHHVVKRLAINIIHGSITNHHHKF